METLQYNIISEKKKTTLKVKHENENESLEEWETYGCRRERLGETKLPSY